MTRSLVVTVGNTQEVHPWRRATWPPPATLHHLAGLSRATVTDQIEYARPRLPATITVTPVYLLEDSVGPSRAAYVDGTTFYAQTGVMPQHRPSR